MADREKLIELLYENNVMCDQKIEGLAEDILDLIANGVTIQKKPKTNADRIRVMSDEELSVLLWEFDKDETAREDEYFITRRKIIEWLQQPVED